MDPWQSIDEQILQRRIIQVMQMICEAEGCGLQQAIQLFADRYEFLRQTRADDFTVSSEEYGHGVYT